MNSYVDFQTRVPASAPDHGERGIRGKRYIVFGLLVLLVAACGFGMCLRFLFHMYETLPSPQDLANIQPSLVTKVLASDSTLIHEFSIERRFWEPLSAIPRELQDAVVAIEDRRFYKHWGIDIKRIISAAFANVIRRRVSQGASTLTQQLARNVYLTSKQTMTRKIREAMTAVQLESYYTKEEILELYLNMVYLGAGAYGVEAASQRYFSKKARDLTLNECAMIAGCIQLPERYRPDKTDNLRRATDRRNTVLRAMRKMHMITRAEAKTAIAEPVAANPQDEVPKKAPYFIELVRQYMEEKYGEHKLYNDGLTILTTLDPVAQDTAERASLYFLDSLQRRTNRLFLDSTEAFRDLSVSKLFFLDHFDSVYAANRARYKDLPDSLKLRIVQTSVVALDVQTGAIKVLIGGRNFNESKFNRAIQARRQPGSAFKPFVYTVAIDSGYTPVSIVMDQPITLETPEGLWRPENYEQEFNGPMTIRDAVKKSINLVAIQVMLDIGIDNVVNYARSVGLKYRLTPVPALAIGACEATAMELTSAYSVYPNYGFQAKPYFIQRVYDRTGRLLEETEPETQQVLSSQTAFIMTSLLTTVVRAGTGANVVSRGFTRPAGGKTGTTNDYSDAWFIGFTPQIACGVWVGVDERRSMGSGVTGSVGAIPAWVSVMKALHRDLPEKGFGQPEGIITERVCTKSHLIATRYCPDAVIEIFPAASAIDTCDVHAVTKSLKKHDVMKRFGTDKKDPEIKPAGRKRALMF